MFIPYMGIIGVAVTMYLFQLTEEEKHVFILNLLITYGESVSIEICEKLFFISVKYLETCIVMTYSIQSSLLSVTRKYVFSIFLVFSLHIY